MELVYDFQKAYDNVNHAFLEKLLKVYGFPIGVQSLIIEMMARWKIRLSYGAKKAVGEVRLENGIIQGDAFPPLLFVLMIDPIIKIMNRRLGDRVEVLYKWMTLMFPQQTFRQLKRSMRLSRSTQCLSGW